MQFMLASLKKLPTNSLFHQGVAGNCKMSLLAEDAFLVLDTPAASARRAIDQSLKVYFAKFRRFSEQMEILAAKGVSKRQYRVYRDNYLFRTATTLPCLKEGYKICLQHSVDPRIVELLEVTISEEQGFGVPSAEHPKLLLSSHNMHGKVIYGLEDTTFSDVELSPMILNAVRTYRITQVNLYSSNSPLTVIGAFVAQESVAESMINLFYKVFFLPLYSRYSGSRFTDDVAPYFETHLAGVEAEHSKRSKLCAEFACKTATDVITLRDAADLLLNAQAKIWDEMFVALSGV